MARISKKTLTILICIAGIFIIFGIKWIAKSKTDSILPPQKNLRSKGHPKAALQIIEFVDFQCPSCAQGWKYLSTYTATHPNQVYVEVKYYPLNMHKHAFVSSRYAECVGRQGQFWPFVDSLFENQDLWKGKENAEADFEKMAEDLKVNRVQLDQCLQDETVDRIIQDDKNEGSTLGVKSTPTYFINGQMAVGIKSLTQYLNNYVTGNN